MKPFLQKPVANHLFCSSGWILLKVFKLVFFTLGFIWKIRSWLIFYQETEFCRINTTHVRHNLSLLFRWDDEQWIASIEHVFTLCTHIGNYDIKFSFMSLMLWRRDENPKWAKDKEKNKFTKKAIVAKMVFILHTLLKMLYTLHCNVI